MNVFATCSKCHHIVDRDYIDGKNRWHCDRCNIKNVRPVWTETPIWNTPMNTEPYEPMDGDAVEVNIDDFQMRLNCNS
jgi:hypothetical protein